MSTLFKVITRSAPGAVNENVTLPSSPEGSSLRFSLENFQAHGVTLDVHAALDSVHPAAQNIFDAETCRMLAGMLSGRSDTATADGDLARKMADAVLAVDGVCAVTLRLAAPDRNAPGACARVEVHVTKQ